MSFKKKTKNVCLYSLEYRNLDLVSIKLLLLNHFLFKYAALFKPSKVV